MVFPVLGLEFLVTLFKVAAHFLHQLFQDTAGMVAGDVVVQVFPDALDAIVIGAVRRQKVQLHTAKQRNQCQLRPLAAVNFVVVRDHVNAARLGVIPFQHYTWRMNRSLSLRRHTSHGFVESDARTDPTISKPPALALESS